MYSGKKVKSERLGVRRFTSESHQAQFGWSHRQTEFNFIHVPLLYEHIFQRVHLRVPISLAICTHFSCQVASLPSYRWARNMHYDRLTNLYLQTSLWLQGQEPLQTSSHNNCSFDWDNVRTMWRDIGFDSTDLLLGHSSQALCVAQLL